MKVYSQLISAQLENKASDYTATVVGRIWWNTATSRIMSADGSLVRAILRNDQKCIFGNSGTASQNIRLHRGASGVLQLVPGDDATAEGTLATSLSQLSVRMENYTTAGLPATHSANTVGRVAWNTSTNSLNVSNGTSWVAASAADNRVSAAWDFVVGSAAQVTSGAATHSTIASAITAASAGDSILILKGTYTENITISKKLYITGSSGNGTVISGTVTFNSSSDYSYLTNVRITGTVTLDSGADGIIVDNIFLASGISFTDNGSGNILMAMQET